MAQWQMQQLQMKSIYLLVLLEQPMRLEAPFEASFHNLADDSSGDGP